jgi:hypothetical protein
MTGRQGACFLVIDEDGSGRRRESHVNSNDRQAPRSEFANIRLARGGRTDDQPGRVLVGDNANVLPFLVYVAIRVAQDNRIAGDPRSVLDAPANRRVERVLDIRDDQRDDVT